VKKPVKKLARLAEQYQAWALEESLPLWWKANRLANGAFYEALDFEGRPVPEPQARVRVQARQIYALALGWKLGFRKKSLPAKLESSIERFFDTCLGPEGLPGRIVNVENGELVDPRPELYNTGFALMALAQSRKVLGGRAVDGRIGRLLDRIDEHLAHCSGDGYREFLPSNTIRLQNPHMHFFESLLVLYKATKSSKVQDRAEVLLNFIHDTFFDQRAGVVQEKVNPNLEMAVSEYEPGHSMEWVWLLGWRSRLFDVPLDPFAVRLYTHYVSAGLPEGEAPMCLTVDQQPVDPSRRLWSQTEALKAHLAIAELGPANLAPSAAQRAIECAKAIREDWLEPTVAGGWLDHFDADGNLIAKDMPASMCYHMYVLVAELKRSAKKLRKRQFD
jgi:mannose-6-phosphate isomerase